MFPGPLVEHWRPIPNWPYEVSSLGRVRRTEASHATPAGHFMVGCVIHGYPTVLLSLNGKRRRFKVHVLVCRLWHGPRPTPKHEAAHGDGNKEHSAYWNLRWATHGENQADMLIHQTSARGERNGRAKLTDKQAAEIRLRYAAGDILQRELAKEYGVTRSAISLIVNQKKHRAFQ